MCAIEAGKRGRKVLLLDHAKAVGEKIRISGGGRCNFTNIHTSPANYLSQNARFCVSALSRYTPADFIRLVEKHRIAYHEKTLGQLFCDGSSRQIIDMLVAECHAARVDIRLNSSIQHIRKTGEGFTVTTHDAQPLITTSVVIATGGLSIPKMGATGFGYDIARQFGVKIVATRPGLVPFTLEPTQLESFKTLAGVSVPASAICNGQHFDEALLFTHRGLSGPVVLQISSYWQEPDTVTLNLAAGTDVPARLKAARQESPKQDIQTALSHLLPKRLAQHLCDSYGFRGKLADMSNSTLDRIAAAVHAWQVVPSGTEGYRTAEVTLGGVDTDCISSKTFEARDVPGLYFIGEVLDVTGHLGGYNFQWAWASGHAAGQAV